MNRRGFFGALAALVTLPIAAKATTKLFPWQEAIIEKCRQPGFHLLYGEHQLGEPGFMYIDKEDFRYEPQKFHPALSGYRRMPVGPVETGR